MVKLPTLNNVEIKDLDIPGCYQIIPNIFSDERGVFVKTFHAETLHQFDIGLELKEEFYSISNKNVLRGLHFQKPPFAHNKFIYCPKGAVLDFIMDIRIGSPTYGKHLSIELNESNGIILFLPVGIAHGFLSLTDGSLMVYKTDCSYAPDYDDGININSIKNQFLENRDALIISQRDLSFPMLAEYKSAFKYE